MSHEITAQDTMISVAATPWHPPTVAGDRTAEQVALNIRMLNGSAPSMTAKPRVVAKSAHMFEVTFGHGGRCDVYRCTNNWNEDVWAVSTIAGRYGRQSTIAEHALREASKISFIDEVFPAWGSAADVHALALACNSDRSLLTKTIKRIAKERFGVKLLAKRGRGTGSGWVHVDTAKGEGIGAQTIVDTLCEQGLIRPCGGERVAVICQLAGHPLPDGFRVQAPQWD